MDAGKKDASSANRSTALQTARKEATSINQISQDTLPDDMFTRRVSLGSNSLLPSTILPTSRGCTTQQTGLITVTCGGITRLSTHIWMRQTGCCKESKGLRP